MAETGPGEARGVGRHPTALRDAKQTAGEGALLPSPAAAAVGGDRFRPNQTTRCQHHLREEPRGTATDRHRFVSPAARRPGERRTAVRAPGVRVDRPFAPYARQICARSTLYIVFFCLSSVVSNPPSPLKQNAESTPGHSPSFAALTLASPPSAALCIASPPAAALRWWGALINTKIQI